MKTHRSRARAHSLVQVSYYMSIGYYYIMYISESRVRCVSLFQTDFTYKHVFFPFHKRAHGFKLAAAPAIHTTYTCISAYISTYYMKKNIKNEIEVCAKPLPYAVSFALVCHSISFGLTFLFISNHIQTLRVCVAVCVRVFILLLWFFLFVRRCSLNGYINPQNERRQRDKESVATTATTTTPPRIAMYTWHGVVYYVRAMNIYIYTSTHTPYTSLYNYNLSIFIFFFHIIVLRMMYMCVPWHCSVCVCISLGVFFSRRCRRRRRLLLLSCPFQFTLLYMCINTTATKMRAYTTF